MACIVFCFVLFLVGMFRGGGVRWTHVFGPGDCVCRHACTEIQTHTHGNDPPTWTHTHLPLQIPEISPGEVIDRHELLPVRVPADVPVHVLGGPDAMVPDKTLCLSFFWGEGEVYISEWMYIDVYMYEILDALLAWNTQARGSIQPKSPNKQMTRTAARRCPRPPSAWPAC